MNIFITGITGAIACQVVEQLAGLDGYQFYGTYYQNEEKAKYLSQLSNVTLKKCDFTSLEDIEAVIKEFESITFDVLINNAFEKIELKPLFKSNWDDVQHSLNTGVRSAFLLTQAFSLPMKKNKSGTIINVLSTAAIQPPAQMWPYAISKSALRGFHMALAEEFKNTGLKVFAVSPDMVETKFIEQLPEHYVNLVRESSVKKTLLSASDVAETIRMLCVGDISPKHGDNMVLSNEVMS